MTDEPMQDSSPDGNRAGSTYSISVLLIDDQKLIGKMVQRLLSEEEDVEFGTDRIPAFSLYTSGMNTEVSGVV